MVRALPDKITPEVKRQMRQFPEYLCLTDLLDQDLSAYEYFQTLSPSMQSQLRQEDSTIGSLGELQAQVGRLRDSGLME